MREDADITKQVAVTLQRIGFEIKNLEYYAARKLNRVQKFKKVKGAKADQLDTQYMPVPYNQTFELYVMAKQSEDALQIVEQILPYFQPDYTVTINAIPEMGIKRDVPITLNSVDYADSYDGSFTNRRAVNYSLSFTSKTYLYGPIYSSKVIKETQTDLYTDTTGNPNREERIVVLPDPTTADADDDFGFTKTITVHKDSKNYNLIYLIYLEDSIPQNHFVEQCHSFQNNPLFHQQTHYIHAAQKLKEHYLE